MAKTIARRNSVVDRTMTLTIGGKVYAGWTKIKLERALEKMASHVNIEVSERWPGLDQPWQIRPFDPCVIKIGEDTVLTGYVDANLPEFSGTRHNVRIVARSQTEDLIDCTPDIQGGQYNGYDLVQIARALCAPFNISVVIQTDVGAPFPNATILRHETAYQYLDRLCRLRAVLACDDELGRLVLTIAGSARATDQLLQGANVLSGTGKLDASKRFSVYKVKTMLSENSAPGEDTLAGFDGHGNPQQTVVQQAVVTNLQAVAIDPAVPRYRPHVIMAEAALDLAAAQLRANWQMRYAIAHGTEVRITVVGWRQSDGSLWQLNQIVAVNVPFLHINADLLIAGIIPRLRRNPVDGAIQERQSSIP